jgi:hypothetical protein
MQVKYTKGVILMTTSKGYASLNMRLRAYKIVKQIALDEELSITATVEKALKIAYPKYFEKYMNDD